MMLCLGLTQKGYVLCKKFQAFKDEFQKVAFLSLPSVNIPKS